MNKLNRLVLEDLFPQFIVKSDAQRLGPQEDPGSFQESDIVAMEQLAGAIRSQWSILVRYFPELSAPELDLPEQVTPDTLLDFLNRLLHFAGRPVAPAPNERELLRKDTRQLLEQSLEGRDLRSRNRRLLEDIFPEFLFPLEQLRLEQIHLKIHGEGRTALCLSGGGIRSATFSLGVLQGLARCGLLERFHYLSTVSGGGYIGSWLSAWLLRNGNDVPKIAAELGNKIRTEGTNPEPQAVRHLRSFSNYLSPLLGFFSADVWTLVAIYLRNLVINWAAIIPILAFVLAIPRICVATVLWCPPQWAVCLSFLLGSLSGSWAFAYLALHRPALADPGRNNEQKHFLRWCIGPLVLFAVFFTSAWSWRCMLQTSLLLVSIRDAMPWLPVVGEWIRDLPPRIYAGLPKLGWPQLLMIAWMTAISLVGTAIAWTVARIRLNRKCPELGATAFGNAARDLARSFSWWTELRQVLVSGVVGGLSLYLIVYQLTLDGQWLDPKVHPERYICFASPVFLLLFLLGLVVFIGLMSRRMEEADREWLARAGAWVLILCVSWVGFSSLVIFGPELWTVTKNQVARYVTASGGLLALLISLFVGRGDGSPAVARDQKPGWQSALLSIAAPLSVLFIIILMSAGSSLVLALLMKKSPEAALAAHMSTIHGANLSLLFGLFVPLLVFGVVVGRLVDMNKFSLHALYRNRLIRAYLGASNRRRRPNGFTGFDEGDDLAISALAKRRRKLFHVVNAALNLTDGKELAWQERKAASFVFTPLHTGSQLLGYRASSQYAQSGSALKKRPVTLGTAVTISGAAVSPNMGYSSSSVTALLLTLFNIRLGWWLGNPGITGGKFLRNEPIYQKGEPPFGLYYLFMEALGLANDQRNFVYLSDGGHFENLGLYEMVWRRCGFIVVIDAGCDPDHTFEDLGNAVRKIRIDMGIPIELAHIPIYLPKETQADRAYCAIGRIRYAEVDAGNPADGTLIYVKPAVYKVESADVRNYATAHPDFPHESTGDQWFSESQFESYRSLGLFVAETVFDTDGNLKSSSQQSVCPLAKVPLSEIVNKLRHRWHPASTAALDAFSRHSETVNSIFDQLRTNADLRFLHSQIYPEWRTLMAGTPSALPGSLWLPATDNERKAGFYVSSKMIQLMENVYLDLRLEQEYEHPDNRGWMNLFKHWSWSGMLRATYAITAATYGARFQSFCDLRLGLKVCDEIVIGDPHPAHPGIPYEGDGSVAVASLNFFENRILEFFRSKRFLSEGDQIYPLELEINDPTKAGQRLTFTFGMAILSPLTVPRQGGPAVPPEGMIHYLRVQDHLRKMGLGRRALLRLLKPPGFPQPEVELDLFQVPDQMIPQMPEAVTPESCSQLRRLFLSAKREIQAQDL